jgi:uncharacterized membrane protein YdjX (TVP38/TMEM64 family)
VGHQSEVGRGGQARRIERRSFGEFLTVTRAVAQARRMSSSDVPAPKKKLPVVKLAVLAVVLLAAAVLVLLYVNVPALIDRTMAVIRGVGPVTFFAAMAVLPAFAVPMSFFTIPAGEAFGLRFGLGGVIAIALVILAVNLALTYWVARYALRPALTGLLKRYGYSVPRVTADNALAITLVVRLTPGPPYAVQGYLLGIAEVSFGLYMIASWLCQAPYAVGFIVLGQGLLKGNFMLAAKGLGVIVVAVILVQWLRKKFAKRES